MLSLEQSSTTVPVTVPLTVGYGVGGVLAGVRVGVVAGSGKTEFDMHHRLRPSNTVPSRGTTVLRVYWHVLSRRLIIRRAI